MTPKLLLSKIRKLRLVTYFQRILQHRRTEVKSINLKSDLKRKKLGMTCQALKVRKSLTNRITYSSIKRKVTRCTMIQRVKKS